MNALTLIKINETIQLFLHGEIDSDVPVKLDELVSVVEFADTLEEQDISWEVEERSFDSKGRPTLIMSHYLLTHKHAQLCYSYDGWNLRNPNIEIIEV